MSNGRKDGRKQLGQWGENIAAQHLEAKGYRLVARNWRCRQGEVDLIVESGKVWIFVEVKTRRGQETGMPEEGLTPHKSQKLMEIAQQYLWTNNLDDVEWRIDLVAVELDKTGKLLRCEHIQNAVLGW